MKRTHLGTALLATLVMALGCGSDSTTGRPVALATRLRIAPGSADALTTDTGWSVRLSRAQLSLGALYYFDGEPPLAQRTSPSPLRRLASLAGLGIARAHPGHYVAGSALGQMTTPAFADVLAGASELPAASGITGSYRSARLVLAPPRSEPGLSSLGTHVARLEGVARKGDEVVYFRLSADLASVTRSVRDGAVDGCVFDGAEVEDDGTVTVTVRPHVWLSLVDFADVAEGTPEMPTEVPLGDTAQRAFALGVVQLRAYHFAYTPAP